MRNMLFSIRRLQELKSDVINNRAFTPEVNKEYNELEKNLAGLDVIGVLLTEHDALTEANKMLGEKLRTMKAIEDVDKITSREFCFWLQGFFSCLPNADATPEHARTIQAKLKMVDL